MEGLYIVSFCPTRNFPSIQYCTKRTRDPLILHRTNPSQYSALPTPWFFNPMLCPQTPSWKTKHSNSILPCVIKYFTNFIGFLVFYCLNTVHPSPISPICKKIECVFWLQRGGLGTSSPNISQVFCFVPSSLFLGRQALIC